jgi:hypothetical protein
MDRVPFMQMVEVVRNEWVRDKARAEAIYKSNINMAYTNLLPLVVDEEHLRKESFITTVADYSTGTVDIAAAGTTIDKGDTATSWTSANSNGALFKEDDNDLVARVDYTSPTQLTFQNSLAWPHSAVDEGSYRLVFDRYALASDYGHMMQDMYNDGQVVYYYTSGGVFALDPLTAAEFTKNFYFTHGTPSEYTVKKDFASDTNYLYINPPDTSTRIIYYNYIPTLDNMEEFTGTATFAATTAVVGSGTTWATQLDATAYDYYIRNDADGTGGESVWAKISSVTDNTNIVLTAAFTGTTGAGQTFTISKSSKYPRGLDRAIMALGAYIADPDPDMKTHWSNIYMMGIQGYSRLDAKRIMGLTLNVDMSSRK